ncbi:nucleoside hydrolase [Sphingomonas sp. Leaf4]|uniref:nucleoside hydrolase n=1 Tax=Sphingomonas sp. Leaf4 TaxID=2876553 RepID=UPI001E55106B|nr:nucleoside hydrolase [Sphingomonas sp. Leaf4]
MDRRSILTAIGAAGCAAILPRPAAARTLSARPRSRVILDNDFSGDPDGLFQLAHHLLSPAVTVPLVIGSHIHPNDFLDKSTTQADHAVRVASELIDRMRLAQRPVLVAGRNAAPTPGAPPEATPAARRIIAEALRTDTGLPLFYAAGAGLTDLAEALRIDPRIASRLKLVWIGGPEHDDPVRAAIPEYNLTIDLAAAQTVFNDSTIEIWQVPRDVYRTLLVSHAELIEGLRGTGALGDYLLDRIEATIALARYRLGETYALGDSPLVTLTALQSAFDADSSSSAYRVRPTPRITDRGGYAPAAGGRPMRVYTAIDTRLTLADMFAKFRAASG